MSHVHLIDVTFGGAAANIRCNRDVSSEVKKASQLSAGRAVLSGARVAGEHQTLPVVIRGLNDDARHNTKIICFQIHDIFSGNILNSIVWGHLIGAWHCTAAVEMSGKKQDVRRILGQVGLLI